MLELHADRAIRTCAEDLLDREPLVDQLTDFVDRAPTDDGFVVGVTGPWGTGKSSLLNLLGERLEQRDDTIVVRFDPWLFSRADELVARFFEEVTARLSSAKGKAAKKLLRTVSSYGAAVSPAANVVLGPAGQLLAAPERMAQARASSVALHREKLRRALAASSQRIVVLIDDVDRLDPIEVREVLRLVKLVADLPNIVHVLAYDRGRVEVALAKAGHEDGRAYLEKIVQASVAVPPLSPDRLRDMTLGWLQEALGARPLIAWNERAWTTLVVPGMAGYLSSLRDARRLVNAAPAAVDLVKDEVASMDVLALEAVRVFDPDIYERLLAHAHLLTSDDSHLDVLGGREERRQQRKREAAELLEPSVNRPATVAILSALFPDAAEHFGNVARHPGRGRENAKRVAELPVLLRYLHRSLSTSEVASADLDRAVDALANRVQFQSLLEGVEDQRLADLFARLRARLGEQAAPDVIGCAMVALELTPRLFTESADVRLDPLDRIRWFVEDLVASLPETTSRAEAARALVEQSPTLSDRYDMLYAFKVRREPTQQPEIEIFDDNDFEPLADSLAAAVAAAPPAELAGERSPLWLVMLLGASHGHDAALQRLDDEQVFAAVLMQSGTELHPLTDGELRLNTDPLVRAAGEQVLALLHQLALHEGLDDALGSGLAAAVRRAV